VEENKGRSESWCIGENEGFQAGRVGGGHRSLPAKAKNKKAPVG